MVQRVAGSNPTWVLGTVTFYFTINQTTVLERSCVCIEGTLLGVG